MLLLRVDCRVGGYRGIQCHVKEVKKYKQDRVAGWLFEFVEALTTNGRFGRFTFILNIINHKV